MPACVFGGIASLRRANHGRPDGPLAEAVERCKRRIADALAAIGAMADEIEA